MLVRLLTIASVVGTCLGGPISTDSASWECDTASPLAADQIFIYTYQGENRMENKDVQHNVMVKATVEIITLSPCLLAMSLRDVVLQEASVANRFVFKEALEKHPVLFRIEEGVIGELRHAPQELPWALNVKRAIISLIQIPRAAVDANSIVTETDVLGACETRYSPVVVQHGQTVVTKTKDLATCFGRFGSSLPITYTPYEAPSSVFQTVPVSNGTYRCEQVVDAKRWVVKAECRETEFLHLAARGLTEQTALTSTAVIVLQEVVPGSKGIPPMVNEKSTLVFDHTAMASDQSTVSSTLSVLRDLCRTVSEDVRPEASHIFARLVTTLRGLTYNNLKQVYSKVSSGELCFEQKLGPLYLDALPLVGTDGSVKQMVELINKPHVQPRSDAWISSLSFIKNPTEGMLAALTPLVRKPNPPKNVVLGVTSLAHLFCRGREAKCEDVKAVRDLQGALNKMLGYKCRAQDAEQRQKVITALKGFGNIGRHGEAVNGILECALAASNPIPVRLAAIEAFRRTCLPDVQSRLLELLKTSSEDVEVRITAYLGVMRCPSEVIVEDVIRMLEEETTNQVGSFIWSHLSNLQQTESPVKQPLHSLLSARHLKNKFSNDIRKASQNVEWSKYANRLNIGGTLDANVVYSPKSFLPRSTVLNLTVDLFSHSINVFEVGARVEGYDYFLEHMLAPKHGDVIESEKPSFWARFGQALSRSRRSPARDVKVDMFDDKVNLARPEKPEGSVYFRMFGSEFSWYELPTPSEVADYVSETSNSNWMSKLFGQKRDMVRSAMLMDTTVMAPTITGFPFRVDVNATVTVGLKTDGRVNTEGAPKDFLLEGYVQPSAVLDISGVMAIDSGVGKRGVRLGSTVHTSTILDGKVEIKSSGEVNINYNMPREKQEILNIKTEIYSVDAESERPLLPQTTEELNGCTRTFSKALGVSVCLRGSVPKPFYGYSGLKLPFNLELSLQKNELSMTGYDFKLRYPTDKNDRSLFYQVIVDTPGSSVDRKHLVELQLSRPSDEEGTLRFTWMCPHKKLEATGTVLVRDNLWSCRAEMMIDESRVYYVRAHADITPTEDGVTILPKLELGYPPAEPLRMMGHFHYTPRETTISVNVNKPANDPMFMRGIFKRDNGRMLSNITARLPKLDFAFGGSLNLYDQAVATSMLLEYKWASMRKHTVKLTSKFRGLSTEYLQKSTGNMEVQSSQYPEYNWQIRADVQRKGAEHRECGIKLWWGDNLPDDQHHIHFFAIEKRTGDIADGKSGTAEGQVKFLAPLWGIDLQSELSTSIEETPSSGRKMNGHFNIVESGRRIIWWHTLYEVISRSPFHLSATTEVTSFDRRLFFSDRLQEKNPGEFEGKSIIEWGRENKNVTLDYVVTLKNDGRLYYQDMDFRISYPNMRYPARHRNRLRVTRGVMEATTQTEIDGSNYVTFEMRNTKKSSAITMDSPYLQFHVGRNVKDGEHTYNGEFRPRFLMPRAFVTSIQHKIERPYWTARANFLWDADDDPEQRISFLSSGNPVDADGVTVYRYSNMFEFTPRYRVVVASDIHSNVYGTHSLEVKLERQGAPRRTLVGSYGRTGKGSNLLVRYFKDDSENFKLEYMRLESRGSREIDARITSVYPEIDGKRLMIKYSHGQGVTCEIKYVHDPSRVYLLQVEDASGNNRINNVIRLTVPDTDTTHEMRTVGEYTPTSAMMNVEYRLRDLLYTFGMNWELRGRGSASLLLEMTTPHQVARNGRFLVKYNVNHREYEGQTAAVFNDETKFDVSGRLNYAGSGVFEGELRYTCPCVRDLYVTVRGNGPVSNGRYEMEVKKSGENLFKGSLDSATNNEEREYRLEFEGRRIPFNYFLVKHSRSGTGSRYSFEHGPDSPYSVVAVSRYSDGVVDMVVEYKSVERPESGMVLTVKYNARQTSDNQLLSVILEPRTGSKASLVYLLQRTEGATVKQVMWSLDDNKLGYEYNLQGSGSDGRHLLKLFYFQREMHVHCDYTRTEDSYDGSWKILLNAVAAPERMMHLTYRRHRIDGGWEAMLTLNHPSFVNELVYKSRIQTQLSPQLPLKFWAELQPGDVNNKIYFELTQRLDDQIPTNKSTHLRLYHEDPGLFDTSFTFYRTTSMESPVFAGYYWNMRTRKQGAKSGHATMFLGENNKAIVDYDSLFGKFHAVGERRALRNGDEISDVTIHSRNKNYKGRIIFNLRQYRFEGLLFDRHGNTLRSLEISASNSTKKQLFHLELSKYIDNSKHADFSYSIERRGNKLYRSRLFFPPRHYDTIKNAIASGQNSVSQIDFASMRDDVIDMADKSAGVVVNQMLDPFASFMASEMGEILGEAIMGFNDVLYESRFGELLQEWAAALERFVAETLERFLRTLLETFNAILNVITGSGRARRRRRDTIDDFASYLSNMMDKIVQSPAVRNTRAWMRRVTDRISDVAGETRFKMQARAEEVLEAIMENPDVKAIMSTMSDLYEPGTYQGNYNFWENMKEQLKGGLTFSDRVMVHEFDRKKGKYIWDVSLPMDADSVQREMNTWTDEGRKDPGVVAVLNSMMSSKLMPPFDGQALIVGDHHFVTFDGTMYSVEGECTYMLTRDFVDGNFTVLLRYDTESRRDDGRPTKSVIVDLRDNLIELFPDRGAVYLNGQPVELPLVGDRGNLVVSRTHDVITVEDAKHLKVSCHLYYDVCSVKIAGWYFGKTAGLLGTFNHEPNDDFIRPRGQVVNNVGQFVKKWEAARGCRGPVKVLREHATEGSEGHDLCSRYFKRADSPLSPGFWKEAPEPYFDLCLRHVASLAPNENVMNGVCNVSFAYVTQLERHGIMATLPTECFACSMPDNTMMEFGKTEDIRTKPQSMDVVFVVEEDGCHGEVIRDIDSTVRLIDRELLNAGFVSNRFGLVGFGHNSGMNSEPHIRTARDKIFFASQDMILATEKMRLNPLSSPQTSKKDIFAAIGQAVRMPYRPGVAKTIILMTCSDCSEERGHLSYSDIQRTLLEHGITLHIVTDKPIKVRKSVIKGRGIYGIDADSVYGSKDVSQAELIGQPDLRPQVATAKDICIALAQEVHGSFFSTGALRGDGKNWKSIFARRVAKPVQLQRDFCERCECIHDVNFMPRTVCRPCRSLSPKVPLALYTSEDIEY